MQKFKTSHAPHMAVAGSPFNVFKEGHKNGFRLEICILGLLK